MILPLHRAIVEWMRLDPAHRRMVSWWPRTSQFPAAVSLQNRVPGTGTWLDNDVELYVLTPNRGSEDPDFVQVHHLPDQPYLVRASYRAMAELVYVSRNDTTDPANPYPNTASGVQPFVYRAPLRLTNAFTRLSA